MLFCSFAVDAADKAKATPAKCQTACPDLYEPICGGPPGATAASSVKPVTFGSTCVLNKYKCESGKSGESHRICVRGAFDIDRN